MPNIALLSYVDSRRAVSVRKSDRVRSDSPESIVQWHWMSFTVVPIHNLIVLPQIHLSARKRSCQTRMPFPFLRSAQGVLRPNGYL
jgi:hypothetical protein